MSSWTGCTSTSDANAWNRCTNMSFETALGGYDDTAWPAHADRPGGLAEFERELIRARTGEGRQRARARGVHLGRKPKLTPHQKREALARRQAGESLAEIARSYDVHHSTISRLQP